MNCPKCGREVPEGDSFCANCGTELSPSPPVPPVCPKCGSEVNPDERYCGKCGYNLNRFHRAPFLKEAMVVSVGSILMFVSLGLPWYYSKFRSDGPYGLSELLAADRTGAVWAGWGLPIVLLICVASLLVITVTVSLWKGVPTKKLWTVLGVLAIACVLGNIGAVFTTKYYFYEWSVHTGFILALVGGITVVIGANRLFFNRVARIWQKIWGK